MNCLYECVLVECVLLLLLFVDTPKMLMCLLLLAGDLRLTALETLALLNKNITEIVVLTVLILSNVFKV